MATSVTTMTGAEFDALPYDEGRRWELLEGDLVDVASPTVLHQRIIDRLVAALNTYLAAHQGIASHDVEFALDAKTRLRPDVWVVLGDRAAELDTARIPIKGCPDLAVEIISPSERAADTMRKVNSYLSHGAFEVWQVYSEMKQVLAYSSDGTIRKFSEGAAITTALLPGFELAVHSVVNTSSSEGDLP